MALATITKKRMKRLLSVFLILSAILGCQDSSNNPQQKTEYSLVKMELYQSKMIEKDFSLISNGPCDDALEDTLHQRFTTYIDSLEITDSTAIIEFKFKDACCQEFLGDYNIINDTLIFEFEQVNDEVCSCICWYRYKLEINSIMGSFSGIKLQGKR